MPRKLRVQYPDATYHVINRGSRHQSIFRDDADREIFLALVANAVDRFSVEIHAYCLMGNHYHLLIRTPSANLDQFMHWLGFKFTRYFNDKYGYDGPLCRDRYQPILVEDDSYLATLIRYIHRNPIDLGVDDLASYKWSSYTKYLTGNGPSWLSTKLCLELIGSRPALQAFVERKEKSALDLMYEARVLPSSTGNRSAPSEDAA